MPAKVSNQTNAAPRMPPKLRLKLANDCDNISTKVKLTTSRKEFKYYLVHSKHINSVWFDKMMALFEPLMQEMYEGSSWGWNKEEKLAEWKHTRTRIMLVVKKDPVDRGDESVAYNQLPPKEDELVSFMCFRFESGANKNESALYVYELHVHPEYQRQGLGEELMRMARVLAVAFKVDKIMLTVFRSNAIARSFYCDKLKFSPDNSTPATNEADYMILSSRVKHS